MAFQKRNALTFFLIVILLNGCYDHYPAPSISGSADFLVVSGFLNAGDGSCSITLSRSQLLSAADVPTPVSDAVVTIDDENGNSSMLSLQQNGVYTNPKIALTANLGYRLHITASNGEVYLSDYVPVIQSPPIDTVDWTIDQQGSAGPTINIYVSSTGTNAQSPYYFWNFAETWKYTAAYAEELKYIGGQVVTNKDSTYYCWRTLTSTNILIASTRQLSQNIVNRFLVNSVPTNSVRLLDGYSLLVTQMSLTQGAFEYWQQLQATTENLGSIFGPLPSQFNGNIHSSSNPSEPVFGYFSASTVSQKRIFINPGDFPAPNSHVTTGNEDCTLTMLAAKDIGQIGSNVIASSYGVGPVGYNITSVDCVDCRFKGGTNIKPDFWK